MAKYAVAMYVYDDSGRTSGQETIRLFDTDDITQDKFSVLAERLAYELYENVVLPLSIEDEEK